MDNLTRHTYKGLEWTKFSSKFIGVKSIEFNLGDDDNVILEIETMSVVMPIYIDEKIMLVGGEAFKADLAFTKEEWIAFLSDFGITFESAK